ncbi:MAG: M23 family metallopeptidase [Gammaproteobacteria bacterium]|nr:M23 family metallopeptidase [Gammaproteobacteria bacterium]
MLVYEPANAQVYKYKDERGKWVFSDKAPSDVEAETLNVAGETKQFRVYLRDEQMDNTVTYFAVNEYPAPVEVKFGLIKSSNISTDTSLPLTIIVPPNDEIKIAAISQKNPNRGSSHEYRWAYMFGDPDRQADGNFLYRVPYAVATSRRVTQGFNGAFSHNHPQAQYAVDIDMPVGTNIYAAREGIVLDVATQFFGSGTDAQQYGNRANNIRIMHADGSMAVYAHLKWDSIRVRPGDRVTEGQYIADSGNTGFTTGPHLHFVIQRNAGMELRAIPFKFRGRNNTAVTPVENMELTAY